MKQKSRIVDYGSIENDGSTGREDSPATSSSSSFKSRRQESWWYRNPAFGPAVSFALLILVGAFVASIRSNGESSSSADLLTSIASSGGSAPAETAKKHIKSATVPYVDNTGRSYSSTQRFYTEQLVDHFDPDNTDTWAHRYYAKKRYWKGPGHPIFLMIGGEGGNEIGFFYAFLERVLAKKFGAYSLHPEHRFYGRFLPVENATTQQLAQLLTPEQAMMDMIQVRAFCVSPQYPRSSTCLLLLFHCSYFIKSKSSRSSSSITVKSSVAQ
jgi:hypothetical protein